MVADVFQTGSKIWDLSTTVFGPVIGGYGYGVILGACGPLQVAIMALLKSALSGIVSCVPARDGSNFP